MNNKTSIIISEGRSNQPARRTLQQNLADELSGRPGTVVTTVPHLYDLAPDGPGMQYLRSVPGDVIVVASLYPRAAYWVLDANGIKGRMGRTSFFPEEELEATRNDSVQRVDEVPDRTIWCLDLRPHNDAAALLDEIERIAAESKTEPVAVADAGEQPAAGEATRVEETTTYRWYPVVDYGRCGNCLECLNFCLFGVFGADESGQLMVEQPDACRDGCPACSRVCPSQAIMFPPHNSPAISGDHAAAAAEFNLDLVQLFGTVSPRDLANAERALHKAATAGRAPQNSPANKPPTDKPPAKDDLDKLVEDLDKMDL